MTKSVYQVNPTLVVFILPVPSMEASNTPPFDRTGYSIECPGLTVFRGYISVEGGETQAFFLNNELASSRQFKTAEDLYRGLLSFPGISPRSFSFAHGGMVVSHLPSKGLGVVMSDIKKLVRGERHRPAIRCDELLEKETLKQLAEAAKKRELEKRFVFGAAYSNPAAFRKIPEGSNIQEIPKPPVGEVAFGGSKKRFGADEFIGYDAGTPGSDRTVHASPAANLLAGASSRRGPAKTFSRAKPTETTPAKKKPAKTASSSKARAPKTTKNK